MKKPDTVDKIIRDTLITFTHIFVGIEKGYLGYIKAKWEPTIFLPSDFDRIEKAGFLSDDGFPQYFAYKKDANGSLLTYRFKDVSKS